MQEWYQENQQNLSIRVKIFLKCPLRSEPTFFYRIVWTKQFLSNFDSTPLTCDHALFPVKISQILQNVIVFFPEKVDEINTSFLHIWIAKWMKFCRTTAHFLDFGYLQEEKRVVVGPKVLTLGPSLLHKQSNPSKVFQAVFLTARVLPLLRISALLDNTGGSKDLKTSQKGLFRGSRIGTENFGNF